MNLQNHYLNQIRLEKVELILTLMSGERYQGKIKAFDSYVIILENEKGKQVLIFKHAIATLSPSKNLNLYPEKKEDENNNSQS